MRPQSHVCKACRSDDGRNNRVKTSEYNDDKKRKVVVTESLMLIGWSVDLKWGITGPKPLYACSLVEQDNRRENWGFLQQRKPGTRVGGASTRELESRLGKTEALLLRAYVQLVIRCR